MFLKLLGRITAASGLLWLAAPAHAEWLEARSPHFTVYGDMSESDLRTRTQRLEQFDALLRRIFGVKDSQPVPVFEVAGLDAVQAAIGDKNRQIGGFYSVTPQRVFAVVPERMDNVVEGFTPQTVIQHEYTHHMLLSNAGVFMPGWAQEGLAEFFSTAQLKADGSVVVGAKPDARGDDIQGMTRWSVRRLLESDLNPPRGDEAIEKYSRGWTMIHYLWLSGQRPGQYTKFIEELNKGTDPVAAGEKVFGDLDKLNHELDTYVSRHTFKLSTFSRAELGEVGPITVRRLNPDEAALVPLRITSWTGVNEKTAAALAARARPVSARFPTSVPVQESMAEIFHDAKDYDAADAAADRALAGDPNSMLGLAYKGRVAVRRALAKKDTAAVVQARSWFRQDARAHQEAALPFVLYYDSFTAVGQTPPADAVAGLYKAVLLVPQDGDLRIRAALALIREGNVARARSIIAPAAFAAEGAGENKALKLLKEMDKTQDKQVLLAKAAELKLDKVNDFIDPPKDDDKGK